MSFKSADLKAINPIGEGGIWLYKTMDTSYSDYFPSDNFQIGDRIYVTVVTNQNKTDEAYASQSLQVVTSVSGQYATVTE